MTKYLSITLPTKTYLKKYMQSLYGESLIFERYDYYGMVIASSLVRSVYPERAKELINQALDKYPDAMVFHMPLQWLKKGYYGTDVDEKHSLFINKMIEEKFEDHLCSFCKLYTQMGIEKKQAIEEFCTEHNLEIDQDISMDNLIKTEYRHRLKKESKLSLKLSCPEKKPFQSVIF